MEEAEERKGKKKRKRTKTRMKWRRMVITARLLVCQFCYQSGSPKI
jgi:hypothetical protein